MINYILALFSEIAYRSIEIFDAFFIISKKLNKSLEFRRNWHRWIKTKSPRVQLWIHGASVGELEDLASFFLSEEALNRAGLKFENIMITASSISASSKLSQWYSEHPFAYCGPIPPEKRSDCQEFLTFFNPKKILLSHADVWPVLFHTATQITPHSLFWLPQKNVELSFLKKRFLLPWLKLHLLRFSEWKSPHDSKFVGNPRVSRILSRIESQKKNQKTHILEAFRAEPKSGKLNIIVGSAWYEDLDILSRALRNLSAAEQSQLNIVSIPHDPQNSHEVARMKQVFPQGRILLEEGILLESYEAFDLVFVGGGFGLGLHNIIEPALWKIPTVCGPRLEKQPEAPWLKELGQLVVIDNPNDLALEIKELLSEEYRRTRKHNSEMAYQKLYEHKDSVDRLIRCLGTF